MVLVCITGRLAVVRSHQVVIRSTGNTGCFVISSSAFIAEGVTRFTLLTDIVCEFVLVARGHTLSSRADESPSFAGVALSFG